MSGRNSRHVRNGPLKVRIEDPVPLRFASSVISWMLNTPATFTSSHGSAELRPNPAAADWTEPRPGHRRPRRWQRAGRRPRLQTSASRASRQATANRRRPARWQTALPMPPAAPVTTATFAPCRSVTTTSATDRVSRIAAQNDAVSSEPVRALYAQLPWTGPVDAANPAGRLGDVGGADGDLEDTGVQRAAALRRGRPHGRPRPLADQRRRPRSRVQAVRGQPADVLLDDGLVHGRDQRGGLLARAAGRR